MTFFNEIFRTLFWIGLLPARYKEKNMRYDVRESGMFGLFSYFKEMDPAFKRYLKKKNVKYRLKKTLDYSPTICFWSKEDHKVYKDAADSKSFWAPSDFYIDLLELSIDHTRRPAAVDGAYYDVFCPTRMVELMLIYPTSTDHGMRRFYKLGSVQNR